MDTIPYELILLLFDQDRYHISYLTYNDLIKLMNFPIKLKASCTKASERKIYNHKECTGLVVVKNTMDYDYSIDKDIDKAFNKIPIYAENYIDYLSLKTALILAGTGQYAKNSLVYDYKFGFETHVGMALIYSKVSNLPERKKPNWNLLPLCDNCNDCKNACPVLAIHNDDYPSWVDWVACNNFNRYGEHEYIPSMKYGWGQYICDPPIEPKILKLIHNDEDLSKLTGYDCILTKYIENNEKKYIQYPICRECTSLPKCSKFNGHYPYDKDRVKIY